MDGVEGIQGLYLAPMRQGGILIPRDSNTLSSNGSRNMIKQSRPIHMGWIPLHRYQYHEKKPDDAIILGRADFLSSMFSACGCSKNVKSSKKKCSDCRSILMWAGNLSRKMLRVTNDGATSREGLETRISFRGGLAEVVIINSNSTYRLGGKDRRQRDSFGNLGNQYDYSEEYVPSPLVRAYELDGGAPLRDPTKWRDPRWVDRGTRISLRYKDEKLEFMVVTEEDLKDIPLTLVRFTAHAGSIVSGNDKGDRLRPSFINSLKNIIDVHNQSNRRSLPSILCEQEDQQDFKSMRSSQVRISTASRHVENDIGCSPSVYHIWFCPRGQDMSRKRIDLLKARLLTLVSKTFGDTGSLTKTELKFRVVDRCFDATHWIVSERVINLASIVKAIPVTRTNEEELRNFLDGNSVECLKPSWLNSVFSFLERSKPPNFDELPPPSARDRWYGYIPSNNKRQGTNICSPPTKRPCRFHDPPPRNLAVSEFFLKLSKIYEQTPCLPDDDMKARQYHLIAGRLQKIDFDIRSDTTIRELKGIPFVGASTIQMIQEIIQTNRLRRLECLRQDPMRVAMRDLIAIWGVGRATALSLIHQGCMTIDQVRQGISSGKVSFLDRRQLIGVECYEDLLEDMSRTEVETIFEQIVVEARKILPDCEAQIMGSYRRGKSALGDVDVLIVSKQYQNKVPIRFLSELVNGLWRNGHISHHLNDLPGLQLGSPADSQSESFLNPSEDIHTSVSNTTFSDKSASRKHTGCATYMCVYLSPTVPGKRRRVDMKIWPYRQKPYASLYFTGGKYFNRSMRQWAKSKFNWKLDDKGLFDRMTGKRVLTDACTEEEIFNKLQLIYKNPADRKFFDDVHPIKN